MGEERKRLRRHRATAEQSWGKQIISIIDLLFQLQKSMYIFTRSSFKQAAQLAQLVDANHERGAGDKRVIILINYSVEITINTRGKLYSISTGRTGARCLSARYLPDKFRLNYLAYVKR